MDTLLREIVLEGFKSFRDKTVLKFDGPFTAVVGPNGSGKSNIVDAIKWVLGDQSPRSIRALTSLEAIYRPANGPSDDPSGFASIIIKIDNSEPDGPDEPSIWEIERRYYRSGESVYTLNGKTTRLKDVRAIMARKGFGLGSLSVVGQGDIDGFLSLVPSDRRLVFEDLARISDFKANKRKILGRLEDCARNDERLRDLLGELSIRVDQLAAQAADARRHAELISSIGDIKAQLAAQEYLLAAKNLERNEKRLGELLTELEESRARRDKALTDLQTARVELENARRASASTLTECEAGRRALDNARAEERRLTDANQHLSTLLGTLESELDSRKTHFGKLLARRDELTEIESTASVLRIESERRKLDVGLYLARRSGFLRCCERERERLASKVERLQGEVSLFARDHEFHSRRADTLEEESGRLDSNIGKLTAQTGELNTEITSLDENLTTLHSRRDTMERSFDETNSNLENLRIQRHDSTEKKRELESERSKLQKEHDILSELERTREGYGEGTKALLESRDKFPGLIGSVAELVHVDAGFEGIIELALGDSLEFLVVGTWDQALKIVQHARSAELDRVTCLVSGLLKHEPGVELKGDIIGHCHIGDGLSDILTYLLGDVSSVEALPESISATQSSALISSDGMYFRFPAQVSGGYGKGKTAGLLTRRARLTELEGLISGCKSAIVNYEGVVKDLNEKVKFSEAELAEVETGIKTLTTEIESAKDRVRKITETRDKAEFEIGRLRVRIGEIREECAGCRENAILAEKGTVAVRLVRRATEESLELVEAEIPSVSGQVSQLRSQLQRAIVEEASYREEAERSRQEFKRVVEDISQANEDIATRSTKINQVREEAKGISEAFDRAVEVTKILEGELPALEEREREASGLIESLADAVASMEQGVEDARIELESMDKAVHSQEVRLAEMKGGLLSLERGLAEYPDFLERIQSGELAGKDIPSRKELIEKLDLLIFDLDELGDVNLLAITEEEFARKRKDELENERMDLLNAEEELRKALEEVEAQSRKAFVTTFKESQERFAEVFASLFPGGHGELGLTNPDDPLESGIDVKVKFPGKGEMDLLQFSGGERSLIALALLFAILKVKPSSFTLLDEVEAALDDINTLKFLDYLSKEFDKRQFIMITHNKITMERADRLYGVTMREGGVSQVVSVDLRKLQKEGIDEILGSPS